MSIKDLPDKTKRNIKKEIADFIDTGIHTKDFVIGLTYGAMLIYSTFYEYMSDVRIYSMATCVIVLFWILQRLIIKEDIKFNISGMLMGVYFPLLFREILCYLIKILHFLIWL